MFRQYFKPPPRPIFGNQDQIDLVRLEAKYKGMKPIKYIDHGCNCSHCEFEVEECPYCGASEEYQTTNDICDDCGKKVIPYDEARKLENLHSKLKDL